MRDRLSPRHRGLAALAIAMVLYGAASAALLHAKKGNEHKSLRHYIHCAVELDQGPCAAMQQIYVLPTPFPLVLPDPPDFPPGP